MAPAFRVAAFASDVRVFALGLDASVDDPLAFVDVTCDGFRRTGPAPAAPGLLTVHVQEGRYLSPRLGANLRAALGGCEGER